MKNSEEFLSAEFRGQLTPEQIRIINGMQFGSRLTLKEKVHESAMQMYQESKKKNPADGGNGGSIVIAARKINFSGKVITNGGDATPGGKPGNAGSVTLLSDSIAGNPTIEARGGRMHQFLDRTPWYKKWWSILIGIAGVVSAVFAVLQYFQHP